MSIAEKLATIAANEQKVFNAGLEAGKEQGYAEGYNEGYNKGGESSARAAALAKGVIERTVTEITASDIDVLGLTTAGWYSFARNDKLKRFISTKEQNIMVNNNAFNYATSLIEAHVGWCSGSSSFGYCSKLQKVVIYGDSGFGWGLFDNCTALKVIDCRTAPRIPSINAGAQVFNKVPNGCLFVVPDNLYDAWSVATNWVAYENIIITKASDYTEYEVVE